MNLVERIFRNITEDAIREGSVGHAQELIDDIERYLKQRNAKSKPYRWKAKGEEILAKIHKAREKRKDYWIMSTQLTITTLPLAASEGVGPEKCRK